MNDGRGPLFHLVSSPSSWPDVGEYRPPSLSEVGFVHFSFAGQLAAVANARYADAEQLYAVEVDPALVGAPIRVEDSYGEGEAYPHVYGPVPAASAVTMHRLTRDADGRWSLIR